MKRAEQPPSLAELPPREVLRRLELSIARRLDGMLRGDHRGLTPGHGTEIGETRRYQPGDDVRRMDWSVTARTQTPHIRETIAERELETWLLADLSPSLDFGTVHGTKLDMAVAAAGTVTFLTARTSNRCGAVLLTRSGPVEIPARSGRDHLRAIMHQIVTHPRGDGGGQTDLNLGLKRLANPGKRRGLAVVVSDFLTPPTWQSTLKAVAARHEVLAIEVLDPRELQLPNVGLVMVRDPETGRRREVQTGDRVFRRRYADAARAKRERTAEALRQAGADHLVLRTDRDWLVDLVRFVAMRRHRIDHLRRPAG